MIIIIIIRLVSGDQSESINISKHGRSLKQIVEIIPMVPPRETNTNDMSLRVI
jgi:hypothetical protein